MKNRKTSLKVIVINVFTSLNKLPVRECYQDRVAILYPEKNRIITGDEPNALFLSVFFLQCSPPRLPAYDISSAVPLSVICFLLISLSILQIFQMPLIQNVVSHLQGKTLCRLDSVSATSVNWVMDKILGKI